MAHLCADQGPCGCTRLAAAVVGNTCAHRATRFHVGRGWGRLGAAHVQVPHLVQEVQALRADQALQWFADGTRAGSAVPVLCYWLEMQLLLPSREETHLVRVVHSPVAL